MNLPRERLSAFSLVEITLALGVTAFCLLAVIGLLPVSFKTQQASIQQTTATNVLTQIITDLRVAVRLPPGQQDKQFSLRDRNGPWDPIPDYVYFTHDGKNVGSNQQTAPSEAVFRAQITYIFPPTETTTLASITVSWPAQIDPMTGGVPAGSVETLAAINR